MSLVRLGSIAALAALVGLAAAPAAYAKYDCTEGKRVILNQGVKSLQTVKVQNNDNVANCMMACDKKAGCQAFNLIHRVDAAKKFDDNTCIMLGTKKLQTTAYPIIKGKQWATVCLKQ